jgi:hypothetical protein
MNKTALTLSAALGLLAVEALAQPVQRPPNFNFDGPRVKMPDRGPRLEMMVERLAAEFALDDKQRQEMRSILTNAQAAALPLRMDLDKLRRATKEAVEMGRPQDELDKLHQQLGATHAKLAAVQSKAFGEGLRLLDEQQKPRADMVYQVVNMAIESAGRDGPGGFGGPGPRFDRGFPGGQPDPGQDPTQRPTRQRPPGEYP